MAYLLKIISQNHVIEVRHGVILLRERLCHIEMIFHYSTQGIFVSLISHNFRR